MATLDDIIKNKNRKNFKPQTYRSWDEFEKPVSSTSTIKKEQKKNEVIVEKERAIKKSIDSNAIEAIKAVHPNLITKWKYKDRPQNELGDIESLANDIKINGQQEPCKVRVISSNPNQYELITGERRWLAVSKLGILLKVRIFEELTDQQASIAQKKENEKHPMSDYAQGMSYYKEIEDGITQQKDLPTKYNIPRQKISKLLSFAKIPAEITEAIEDMTKISCSTAEKIKMLSSKGEEYINAIIKISDKLRSGKVGHSSLEKQMNNIINPPSKFINASIRINTPSGRHIFTWRTDNNGRPSIHFPKNIAGLLTSEKLDMQGLSEKFSSVIDKELLSLENKNTFCPPGDN